jgi:hypothetical protein
MKQLKLSYLVGILCVFCFFSSCNMLEDEMESYREMPKDIVGSWKIEKAIRNEIDITEYMNFSDFRINFTEDGSYTIENYLPFIIKENGGWSLDDPAYPFLLSFDNGDGGEALSTEFNYPIVEGERQLKLTFSPGCYRNVYTYVLVKETN